MYVMYTHSFSLQCFIGLTKSVLVCIKKFESSAADTRLLEYIDDHFLSLICIHGLFLHFILKILIVNLYSIFIREKVKQQRIINVYTKAGKSDAPFFNASKSLNMFESYIEKKP